ncbi:hypothetical protein BDZ89DRAFT_303713 [Hymenopellis radicata]|nr:hypothetical protein BDZ89DRAFT_470885 [Hymenopellis radicata]KAF9041988.1 hypothetical protein BDZ89DRAFT_303713 [Hymenopellis radicata]
MTRTGQDADDMNHRGRYQRHRHEPNTCYSVRRALPHQPATATTAPDISQQRQPPSRPPSNNVTADNDGDQATMDPTRRTMTKSTSARRSADSLAVASRAQASTAPFGGDDDCYHTRTTRTSSTHVCPAAAAFLVRPRCISRLHHSLHNSLPTERDKQHLQTAA